MKAFTSFDQLLEVVREEKPKEGFSAVCSNPPYQDSSNDGMGKNKAAASAVWPDFIDVCSSISNKASIVNPARWTKGAAGTGLESIREYFLKSGHLESALIIKDSSSVFPSVGIAGGVSIELLDFTKKTKPKIAFVDNLFDKPDFTEVDLNSKVDILLTPKSMNIVSKILNKNVGPSYVNKIWATGRGFLTKDPSSVIESSDIRRTHGVMSDRILKDHVFKNIKNEGDFGAYYLVGSKSPGIKYINSDLFEDSQMKRKVSEEWKVLFPNTNANTFYRNMGPIASPGEMSTDTWAHLSFSSRRHAENFESYVKTYFHRFLVAERVVSHIALSNVHKFVPDLATVTNPRTDLVGYSSDWTDEDLKKLFEDVLTEDDWAYIEKTAIESDPAGAKK